MNRLKIAGQYSSALYGDPTGRHGCQIAQIEQRPPKDWAPGDRSSWPRSPAALKAYAISKGYILVGTRQSDRKRLAPPQGSAS